MSIAHIVGALRNSTFIVAPTVTWNPSDKNSDITLSSFDLVATKTTSASWRGVRANAGKSSGKYYYEAKFESFSGSFIDAGLANFTDPLTNYPGSNTNSIAVVSDGIFYYNATGVASGVGAFSTNDILCIAVDITNAKVWFRRNNGQWYGAATISGSAVAGDPAANTNGRPLTITGTIYPIAGLQSTVPGDRLSGRFKASDFSYAPPLGFSAWEDNSFIEVLDQRMYAILGPANNTIGIADQRMYAIIGPSNNTIGVADQRMYVIVNP